MNIGFFYGMQTYPPTTGGTVHGYQLVRQLIANGHRLQNWYFGSHDDPDIHNFRGRELMAFLRQTDLAYIRLEWRANSAAISLLRLASLNRLPVVWELNGTPDELLFAGSNKTEIERITARIRRWAALCTAAIGVTEDVSRYARDSLGIRNVVTIPNGSDPTIFQPEPKNRNRAQPLDVVWIGTSSAGWHDLACLIEAARLLEQARANIQIRVFGDKGALAGLSLPANIRLEGSVPYTKLSAHLATADVGVHLFKTDDTAVQVKGSPLKLFDYMACGLAVLVNCDGQQADIIRAHGSGVRCEPTAAAVAQALSLLEQDRELCTRMGANGRAAVVTTYNWAQTGKLTSQFLEGVLDRRRH